MSDDTSHVFDLLSERGVAKSALRRHFSEDSCINSTRVLFDVYRAVRISAEAASVRTRIYSPGFVNRAYREGRMPESAEEVHSWTLEPGVWSVGIGHGLDHGKNKWPGHLVLRSEGDLIDATIDQANRPQHGIVMPPMLLLAHTPDAFWRAEDLLGVEVNDCQVVYESRPRDNSYLVSPAWSGRSHVEGAVASDLIRYLESKGVKSTPAARDRMATRIRQRAMGDAVRTLRQRIGWTQDELAVALEKYLDRISSSGSVAWQGTMISKWEHGADGPSSTHRMALTKIALKYGYEDLASIFRMPIARRKEPSNEAAG
ncbi:MAG: hypothetical protein LAQ69_14450 [Acidobacteriia bacterium]|nr:hypothetical protein [Terriglobia bacterium]